MNKRKSKKKILQERTKLKNAEARAWMALKEVVEGVTRFLYLVAHLFMN